jgi:hypothetical protein
VVRKSAPFHVCHGYPLTIVARLIDMIDYRLPNQTSSGILRTARFATNAKHHSNVVLRRRLVAPDNYHRRRPVAGYVCPRNVSNKLQIPSSQELLDQFRTKLPLHKGIRGDLAAPTGRVIDAHWLREMKKALHEWHG